MSVRRFVIQLLRVVIVFVCGLTVSSACSQSDDARPGAEERRLSVAASATQSQGMPLVVVPPDSPRFKQLRIELVFGCTT